jgi:ABC-type uncharacterized transport system involved in gliding motility auxiliary subunit
MRIGWEADVRINQRARLNLRLTHASFVILFLAVIGLLMWATRTYHAEFDWTRNGRNSLSEASIGVLERLDKPVTITAFARKRQDLRESIRDLIARYQRVKPDIHLAFVNPDTEPERTRKAGIEFDGELLIQYNHSRETVQHVKEEAVTNALARLARGGQRLVVFLGGHGERSPVSQGNAGLSAWSRQLTKRGLHTRSVVLGEGKGIPKETSVLVIATPQSNFLPGEVKQITDYLNHGGNLLWLQDPGGLHGLEPVAEMLGAEFEPGTIVDPTARTITGNATFTVVASYPNQPIVKGFNLMTLFPEAEALQVKAPDGWQATPFLETLSSAWAETGELQGMVQFDPGKDISGPLDLGVALTHDREKREQRVVIVGDGDFVSNSFIGEGGNLDLAMKLVNWTTHDDAFINIPTRTAADVTLTLSRTWQGLIAGLVLVVLPLGLIGSGLLVWLRRRKR